MISNTCCRRSICPSVSSRCFSNAALSSGEFAPRQGLHDLPLGVVDVLERVVEQVVEGLLCHLGSPIATAAGLTVPTALDQRHQGLIDNLRGATDQDFDRVYLQQQEAAHNETAALLETYSRVGGNDALKGWAAKTLPVVRSHREMVDQADEADAERPH